MQSKYCDQRLYVSLQCLSVYSHIKNRMSELHEIFRSVLCDDNAILHVLPVL